METLQLSFGWGEQQACLECGAPFVVSYVRWLEVENFGAGVFGSVHFCSRVCAEKWHRRKEEADNARQEFRRKWG